MKTILVIEKDPVLMRLLQRTLSELLPEEVELVFAGSWFMAFTSVMDKGVKKPFNVVLTCWDRGEAEEFLKYTPNICNSRVIVMTGGAKMERVQRAHKDVTILQRPFNLHGLTNALKEVGVQF